MIFQEKFSKLECLIEYRLSVMGKLFADKLSTKAGGAVIDFPRFALAHCS